MPQPFPTTGIPLYGSKELTAPLQRAAIVPLPIGMLAGNWSLALYEDDKPIPASFEVAATWSDGSVAVLHVYAVFKQPNGYVLKSGIGTTNATPSTPPTLSTYVVDGRGIRFEATNDQPNQTEPGNTIRSEGAYREKNGSVPPICRFVTRATGGQMNRYSHHTILTADSRIVRIADMGIVLRLTGNVKRAAFGIDGKTIEAEVGASLQQTKHNECLLTTSISGSRSDGWAAAVLADGTIWALLVRDLHQKYPKEIEVTADGFVLHQWPKHGRTIFTREEVLDKRNLGKFLDFHQGKFLDLNVRNDVYEALETQTAIDTQECLPTYALNGNAQGTVLSTHFAVVQVASLEEIPALQKLFQADPVVMASPQWIHDSQILGKLGPKLNDFPQLEQAIEAGLLGWANSTERHEDYGWANYGDAHHIELPTENRASLHRHWQNNHYQQLTEGWLHVCRSGADIHPEIIRYIRALTDHTTSIDQVCWDGMAGGKLDHPYHKPGSFRHCKGLTHWGGNEYGQPTIDDHAALAGHYADPTGLLFAWLFDGDRWAKEGYELWLKNYSQLVTSGTAREANTSLYHLYWAYWYTHDAKYLTAAKSLATSLIAKPLAQQEPGPLFHPLFLLIVFELLGGAAEKWILDGAKSITCIDNTEALVLSVLAWEITRDRQYLARHIPYLATLDRWLYKEPGSPWNNFGLGPVELGDNRVRLQIGFFVEALRQAGISQIDPSAGRLTYCCYPFASSRWNELSEPRHTTLLVNKTKDGPFDLNVRTSSISGGDVQGGLIRVFAPSGKQVFQSNWPAPDAQRFAMSGSVVGLKKTFSIPDNGENGLFRVVIGGNELGLFSPLTQFAEGIILRAKNARDWGEPTFYRTTRATGWLIPLDDQLKTLTITAKGRGPTHVRLVNGNAILAEARLLAGHQQEFSQQFDIRAPFMLDLFSGMNGYCELTIDAGEKAAPNQVLFARTAVDVALVRNSLLKK